MIAVERGRTAAEAAIDELRPCIVIESPVGENTEATGAEGEERDAPLKPRRHE